MTQTHCHLRRPSKAAPLSAPWRAVATAATLALLATLTACGPDSGPAILDVTRVANTTDTVGPYIVRATVVDDRSVDTVRLWVGINAPDRDGFVFEPQTMRAQRGDTFESAIAGQPAGTQVRYYVEAIDDEGQRVRHPADAPESVIVFSVLGQPAVIDADAGDPNAPGPLPRRPPRAQQRQHRRRPRRRLHPRRRSRRPHLR